ncbi:hypothetical protein ACFIJ5_10565 [Haloimpatiens sp. FM7330]|uniref:hypothetical protein n=1 Tax=Haloimpatiens sp. FM7330 TaxID=3298610 RepID=UPI003643C1BA
MLNNHKKIKILVVIAFIIWILLAVAIKIVKLKGYYLIYDWMYSIIIYMILFLGILLSGKNRYLKRIEYGAICIMLIINTKCLLDNSKNKMFIFKSPNLKNEIIIKEFVKKQDGMDEVVKTLDLKRRFYLFARKNSEYPTKNAYRSFSAGSYKVNWIKDNIAVVNYLYNDKSKIIKQHVYTFNSEKPSSYKYVEVSIRGMWKNKEKPNDTLTVKKDKVIYVKDGKKFIYDTDNAKQKGYTAVVFDGVGKAPDLSIVFNEGVTIDSSCLLKKTDTIFIGYVSLEDEKYGLFEKVD